ncbi:hypothetical protein EV121DRAFT_201734 [Schizophyllum commune]
MARFSFVLASLALALLASATPMPRLESIPEHATKLAIDDVTKRIVAYDARGVHLGFVERDALLEDKRDDTGSCTSLSADDVQKLPGWTQLEQQANDNWGTGSRRIVTNDKDYLDRPAEICVEDASEITVNGDPECTTQTQSLDTTITGTNGTATVSETTGTKFSSSQTVSEQSSIAIGEKFTGIKVKIPKKISNITSPTYVEATFTNTLATTEASEVNQQSTQSVSIAVADGKTCKVNFDVSTCTAQGEGQVPFVATGWVWFEYDDKTEGHYKWALKIDDVLSNKDDRSTFLKFNAQVKSDTNGEYKAEC